MDPSLFWSLEVPFTWQLSLAAISGIAAHLFFWIRGERDSIAWVIIALAIIFHILIALLQIHYLRTSLLLTHISLFCLEAAHLIALFASIFVYRTVFHPLRKFPGPYWAKVSVLWRCSVTYRTRHRHAVELDKLHQQYGDIVRIGISTLE